MRKKPLKTKWQLKEAAYWDARQGVITAAKVWRKALTQPFGCSPGSAAFVLIEEVDKLGKLEGKN